MKLYWPVARIEPRRNDPFGNKLHTYDSALTQRDAEQVIFRWANDCGYHIIEAWVDVYDSEAEGAEPERIPFYKDHDACVRADNLERQWAEIDKAKAESSHSSNGSVFDDGYWEEGDG